MAQHMHFCMLDGVGSGWCHVWDSHTAKTIMDLLKKLNEQGRTVVVDGWVLAVTEARQAALFSLTPA